MMNSIIAKKVLAVVGAVVVTSGATFGTLKVLDKNTIPKTKVEQTTTKKETKKEDDLGVVEQDNRVKNSKSLDLSAYNLDGGQLYKFLKDNGLYEVNAPLRDKAYTLHYNTQLIRNAFQNWENRDNIMVKFMDWGNLDITRIDENDLNGLKDVCYKKGYSYTKVCSIIGELIQKDYHKFEVLYDRYNVRVEQEIWRETEGKQYQDNANTNNTSANNNYTDNNNEISQQELDENLEIANKKWDDVREQEQQAIEDNWDNATESEKEWYNDTTEQFN